MSRSYSVFVDDMYYYDFVALYNSWKYYENKVPLKVYSHRGLNKKNLANIEKHCEVIHVDKGDFTDYAFNGKYLFKLLGMINNMADNEILLDADTIFLSNTDYLFDYIENGNIIGSVENDWRFKHLFYYKDDINGEELYENNKKVLRKVIGNITDNYSLNFINKVYNAGFLGLNKKKHLYLLENTFKLLSSDEFVNQKNPTFFLEQYMISFLIKLYEEDVYELHYSQWMNTWHSHKTPKKIIKVDDGKLVLYNENGSRINFYHFTGDIGMMHPEINSLTTCRPHQIYETAARELLFEKKDVYDLWIKKHESPVILLYQYFADMGL